MIKSLNSSYRVWSVTFAIFSLLWLTIPSRLSGQERAYFGNLHSHTSYSDGVLTPRNAYRYARDVAKLDFLALTEHNHDKALGKDKVGIATNRKLYNGTAANSLIRSAKEFTKDDKFVALYGQEYSVISRGNHTNVFEIPSVITAESGQFDQLVDFLKSDENLDSTGLPAIVMFNHPSNSSTLKPTEYGLDDFGGDVTKWKNKLSPHVALMQMINGPGQKAGRHFVAELPRKRRIRNF